MAEQSTGHRGSSSTLPVHGNGSHLGFVGSGQIGHPCLNGFNSQQASGFLEFKQLQSGAFGVEAH